MSNKIKFLSGRYVYLEMPEIPKSKVIVDENTKDALQKALLKEHSRLKIFAKGPLVAPEFAVGEYVLAHPSALTNIGTVIIPLEDETGRKFEVVLVQDHQLIHVWEDNDKV